MHFPTLLALVGGSAPHAPRLSPFFGLPTVCPECPPTSVGSARSFSPAGLCRCASGAPLGAPACVSVNSTLWFSCLPAWAVLRPPLRALSYLIPRHTCIPVVWSTWRPIPPRSPACLLIPALLCRSAGGGVLCSLPPPLRPIPFARLIGWSLRYRRISFIRSCPFLVKLRGGQGYRYRYGQKSSAYLPKELGLSFFEPAQLQKLFWRVVFASFALKFHF